MTGAPPKKRILFVDDDDSILDGLRNLLYRDRRCWDMEFVSSAGAALEQLHAQPFDVLVTDMRMPCMDGASLLRIVQAEFPATVRIILSGYAERASVMSALPAMHQYLTKPCDAETLRSAIRRCLHAISQPSPGVLAVIGRLDRLPSPPPVYLELSRVTANPAATVDAIASIVGRDVAFAAKVLQLANSAAFGAIRPTADLKHAVAHLGADLLRCLALTTSVFSAGVDSALPLEELRHRAIRTANLARQLVPRHRAEIAFAAGLLLNVGEVALGVGMPVVYAEILREAHLQSEPVVVAERRELGVTHAEIGASLLEIWGIPQPIVDLVAHHHAPRLAPSALREEAATLHAADALATWTGGKEELMIDHELLTSVGLAARLDDWCILARA